MGRQTMRRLRTTIPKRSEERSFSFGPFGSFRSGQNLPTSFRSEKRSFSSQAKRLSCHHFQPISCEQIWAATIADSPLGDSISLISTMTTQPASSAPSTAAHKRVRRASFFRGAYSQMGSLMWVAKLTPGFRVGSRSSPD